MKKSHSILLALLLTLPVWADGVALLEAIKKNPDEDTPRLAYADWLDEHGDEADRARAEFIRAQIELETVPPGVRQVQLRERAHDLLREYGDAWTPQVVRDYCDDRRFRRGFLHEISIRSDRLLWGERAKELAQIPGLTRLNLRVGQHSRRDWKGFADGRFETILHITATGSVPTALVTFVDGISEGKGLRLQTLDFRTPLENTAQIRLANSSSFASLTTLKLEQSRAGAEAFAESKYLTHLKNLTLYRYGDSMGMVDPIATLEPWIRSKNLAELECLDIEGVTGLSEGSMNDVVRHIAASNHMKSLKAFRFSYGAHYVGDAPSISDAALEILARSDNFKGLKELYVQGAAITARGLEHVEKSKAIRLTHLTILPHPGVINPRRLRNAGLEVIARSAAFSQLEVLMLPTHRIGDEGVAAVAESKYLKNLRVLNLENPTPLGDVYNNNVQEAGVAALLNSANLDRLATLNFWHNDVATLSGISVARPRPNLAQLSASRPGGMDSETGAWFVLNGRDKFPNLVELTYPHDEGETRVVSVLDLHPSCSDLTQKLAE